MRAEIEGYCDARFAAVREVFADNFARMGEVGAAVAVVLDGKAVVDLWGGFADRARTRPWRRDTIVNVWSVTKGLTALCAHRLADRNRLDFELPAAHYWPEFAAAGKAAITVAMLLNHRAGLPAVAVPLADETIYDWRAMTEILAAAAPWWPPGSRHGYHALTFGWLVGEVIRRAGGRSVGTMLREEIAAPLEVDCFLGNSQAQATRIAEMIGADPPAPGETSRVAELLRDRDSLTFKALANPPSLLRANTANLPAWRQAEIPAANGHTNARALARIYGALASGGTNGAYRLLEAESIARCGTEQSGGYDEVLQQQTHFSLGFMLPRPDQPWAVNPRTFGHPGAGGSLGFADPDARVGFGYTMNKMRSGVAGDPRADGLIRAVYASL
jgi:CubicO group peptidase (beta-lactamase class C family)